MGDRWAALSATDMAYTVVETTRGFLYLVLLPSTGKLLYDARSPAPTAAGAAAALRTALGAEVFGALVRVTPEAMLGRIMAFRVEGDSGA
jgi:hypothetical protein